MANVNNLAAPDEPAPLCQGIPNELESPLDFVCRKIFRIRFASIRGNSATDPILRGESIKRLLKTQIRAVSAFRTFNVFPKCLEIAGESINRADVIHQSTAAKNIRCLSLSALSEVD